MDEYLNKFMEEKLSLEGRLAFSNSATNNNNTVHTNLHNDGGYNFNFPKLVHTKFSGELKEWLKFWSYLKKVHKM